MSLTKRILLFFFLTVISALIALFAASELILRRSYETIEIEETRQNLLRATNALDNRLDNLEKIALGYSQWDETRDFVLGTNPGYPDENMTPNVYTDSDVEIQVFINLQGEIVKQQAYSLESGAEMAVPQSLLDQLNAGSALLFHSNAHSRLSGLVSLPEGTLLVVSQPITNNTSTEPVNGYMIWGRYIDAGIIGQISESTRLDIAFEPYYAANLSADFLEAREKITADESFFVQAIDGQTVSGFTVVHDIYGQPALMVRILLPRTLYQQGQASLSLFLGTLAVIGTIASIIAFMIVNRVILKRVGSLSNTVTKVMKSNDLTTPVTVHGRDEMGNLADGMRAMLASLAKSRQELLDHNSQLEQRVAERTAELTRINSQLIQSERQTAQARDEALEALRVRSQIIANISHDSRTPLTAIGLNVDILKKEHFGSLTEKQAQILERIMASNKRLTSLITNLLSEAQLNNDKVKLNMAPLVPRELVKEMEKLFVPLAEHKGLTLVTEIDTELPEKIMADAERLKQVLSNLVDNAIKFTEQGSVKMKFSRPDADHWSVQVTDSGQGIPLDSQPRIFDAFWQVDGSATRIANRGVGLGLSIVKRLVTVMNGDILVKSEAGHGTTFIVTIPLSEPVGDAIIEPAHIDR